MRALVIGLFLLVLCCTPVQAKDAWVVWLPASELPQTRTLEGGSRLPAQVPLGSLWKLFVYAYLDANNGAESAYKCTSGAGKLAAGEEYCCDAGESITRNVALARSCGRYFEPSRLLIIPADWTRYWKSQAAPLWLQDFSNLTPAKKLSVLQILEALRAVPSATRFHTRAALAQVSLQLGSGSVLAALGTGLRFKTYSWDHPSVQGASIGGAAGWLADGTPFWLGGQGVSREVVPRLAQLAKTSLPQADAISAHGPCVLVNFLTRYPIQEVLDANRQRVNREGVLAGHYRVKLENQKVLPLFANPSAGEVMLEKKQNMIRLTGRFTLNEYVARVIDREADASPTQAAQALAVTARTYLLQNASFEQGCFTIADDSRTQRVSVNPASRAARIAALTTDELILEGSTVRYHRDQAAPGVMSWQEAVSQSNAGKNFTAILSDNWPSARLAALDGSTECKPIVAAQDWLARVVPQWRLALMREPGFEPPSRLVVCELAYGNPYADVRRQRIYTRLWQSHEGKVTLAHEFIHLAFAAHPNGSDEAFAEGWARRLLDPVTRSTSDRGEPKAVRVPIKLSESVR